MSITPPEHNDELTPQNRWRSASDGLRRGGRTRTALLLLTVALIAGLAGLAGLRGGLVEADTVPGEVTNLRLSSDTPGALTITWDAPSSAPADYRIAWARDDLSWLSWNASNETHRGSSYPGGADTSLTLTGLTGGETYKVRMRSRYNPGTSDGWSGPWTGEVTQRVTVHASDEVTSLTLDSSAGGELVIEWNTPTDEPNDYRISWAPADEDYLSYSEDNTDRRGNSYPDGDATSLTLTNLPGGVTYKTMMRARYHNEATQEDSSGPWTAEVTQQIQNNPPAAPTGLRTLATDQEVTLEWDDPDDDTITGYEIWRGVKASSLQVLVPDTGSAGNSYADNDVTPETTYHYAINAINAAGASQQSDTISATTQAPRRITGQGRRR